MEPHVAQVMRTTLGRHERARVTKARATELGVCVLLFASLGLVSVVFSPSWVLHLQALGVPKLGVHPITLARDLLFLWVMLRFVSLAPRGAARGLLVAALVLYVLAAVVQNASLPSLLAQFGFAAFSTLVGVLFWMGLADAEFVGSRTAWLGGLGSVFAGFAYFLVAYPPASLASVVGVLINLLMGVAGAVMLVTARFVLGVHLLRWQPRQEGPLGGAGALEPRVPVDSTGAK